MFGTEVHSEGTAHRLVGGSIVGRYQLSGLLGRGGMGEVHAGTDRWLHRPVAVKVVRADLVGDPEVHDLFEREAQVAAQLLHPRVVAVFDTGEERGVPYLVMERLPGTTLADRISEGPLPPDAARRVGTDVLDALGAAHDAGIVHRDVKPGNVLLAADGTWKVGDFGIADTAEPVHDRRATSGRFGTRAYGAPERLEGAAASPASDLYSVGVVLYEALTGRKPFTAGSPFLGGAIRAGRPVPLADLRPEIDPSLAAVVHRAIERNPRRRFTSAAEMASALEWDGCLNAANVRRTHPGPRQSSLMPPRLPAGWPSTRAMLPSVQLKLGLRTPVVLERDRRCAAGGSDPTQPLPLEGSARRSWPTRRRSDD